MNASHIYYLLGVRVALCSGVAAIRARDSVVQSAKELSTWSVARLCAMMQPRHRTQQRMAHGHHAECVPTTTQEGDGSQRGEATGANPECLARGLGWFSIGLGLLVPIYTSTRGRTIWV